MGFVLGVEMEFKAHSSTGDYHPKMNQENFRRWMEEKLIPNLPPSSVLVLDNAGYHNIQVDRLPTSTTRKADIQAWLTRHGISFSPNLLKAELLDLC